MPRLVFDSGLTGPALLRGYLYLYLIVEVYSEPAYNPSQT